MSKKHKKEARTKKNEKKAKRQTGRVRSGILSLLDEHPGKGLTLTQIIRKLGFKKKEDIKKAAHYLDDQVEQGRIKQLSSGNYVSNGHDSDELEGVVDHVSSRFAYIKVGTDDDKDIYVKSSDLASAVDGDTVKVVVFPTRHGEHPEGKVTEIVRRNRSRFVGKIEVSKNFAFVVADSRKIHDDFFIYPENINGAVHGDKVIIEVISWADKDRKAEAKVVEVLGKAGENEAEIHSIMAEFDLPFRFPEAIQKEASTIDEGITAAEIKNRRDFRDVTTFTIDPYDAKDFDDAISFRKLENGNYEIGVHIADVTHYVRMNSGLDKEAKTIQRTLFPSAR
jgi:ribonuclease R